MSDLFFSIITVSFNAEKTIARTIESVLAQNHTKYEYIIVDGASTDKTIEIVSYYKDERIKCISEPDKGVYDAMNKGLKMANGDYLLFLGSDDILFNEDVLKTASKCINGIFDIVYYGDVIKKKNQKRYDGEFTRMKWGYENICHQSIFYPYNIYKSHPYDLSYKLVADWVYNLVLLREKIRFEYIELVVSEYNDCDGVSSLKNDKQFLKDRRTLIIEAVGIIPYLYGIIRKGVRLLFKK